MTKPNTCPSCGEFVSLFAAGCAICGAELDPFRGQRRSVGDSLRSAWLSRPRLKAKAPVRTNRR
jgi:hypothetical protein